MALSDLVLHFLTQTWYILTCNELISLSCSPTAPVQDICPGYYCSYNMLQLDCQQINKTLLDQFVIKDNPELLKYANCSPDNRTETIPDDHVVWLRYEKSGYWELENHQFAKYINLNVLMLNDSNLQMIRYDSFDGLSHLEYLHLQNNWISFLRERVFRPLKNIAWIDLSNNNIASLPENTFRSNTKLKGLDLRKNPLTKIVIPAESPSFIDNLFLSNCNQLREVQLAVNVNNLTLENSAVERLKISGRIQSIRAGNSKLTHLDLHGARLDGSRLSDILCRIRSLEWLDLSETALNTINLSTGEYYCECRLPNLRFLNLSTNYLESLPMGSPLFGRHLTSLYLSKNYLKNVSLETFEETQSLQSLHLDGNFLTSFDYNSLYDQFKNLRDFTINGNKFNATYYNAMAKYLNQRLYKGEQTVQKVPTEEKVPTKEKVPTEEKVSTVEKTSTKEKVPTKEKVSTKEKESPKEKLPTPPKVEETPKNQNVSMVNNVPKYKENLKVEKEQMDQSTWLWITVSIIVVLLIALVWQVMRNRGSNCFGCQSV